MQSSLRDLNSKVPEPMDMNRFRPNIVIDDSVAPWEEDNWQSFTLGGAPDRAVTFHSLKPCSRCKVPSYPQRYTVPHDMHMCWTCAGHREGALEV